VAVIRARLQFELSKVRLLAAIGQLANYGSHH
jgi:hypothetical protein